MKQNAQVRTKFLTAIMAGVAGVGFVTAATAVGIDHTAVGAGAEVAAPIKSQAGGRAEANMDPTGSASSNAQWQSGATRGADRAAERASTTVEALEQSTAAELEAIGKPSAKRSGTR